MPIVLQKSDSFYRMLVWESVEPMEELFRLAAVSGEEEERIRAFKSENRRREFLTVRAALRTLYEGECPAIIYTATGKPALSNRHFVSISHTADLIALITSETRNVGIDIEIVRESIVPVSRKFVNESEQKFLQQEHLIEQLHIIWSAKEVLYKIYGKKEVDFRKELHVEEFSVQEESLFASITKSDYVRRMEICFMPFKGAMMGWGVEG